MGVMVTRILHQPPGRSIGNVYLASTLKMEFKRGRLSARGIRHVRDTQHANMSRSQSYIRYLKVYQLIRFAVKCSSVLVGLSFVERTGESTLGETGVVRTEVDTFRGRGEII